MNGGCATYLKNATDSWVDFLFVRALSGQSGMMTMANADAKKEGWNAEELGEQSSYEGVTEISRRLRRGDETRGDPDARDVAGATPDEDSPNEREVRDTPQRSDQERGTEEVSGK